MSDTISTLNIALRRLTSALERLTDDEVSKFIDPSFDVEIKLTRRKQKEVTDKPMEHDLAEIVVKLTAFPSRPDALGFLLSNFETKKSLEPIARHLDIPIIKQDKVEILREKIVEATTGARIRSEAIKGTD